MTTFAEDIAVNYSDDLRRKLKRKVEQDMQILKERSYSKNPKFIAFTCHNQNTSKFDFLVI